MVGFDVSYLQSKSRNHDRLRTCGPPLLGAQVRSLSCSQNFMITKHLAQHWPFAFSEGVVRSVSFAEKQKKSEQR